MSAVCVWGVDWGAPRPRGLCPAAPDREEGRSCRRSRPSGPVDGAARRAVSSPVCCRTRRPGSQHRTLTCSVHLPPSAAGTRPWRGRWAGRNGRLRSHRKGATSSRKRRDTEVSVLLCGSSPPRGPSTATSTTFLCRLGSPPAGTSLHRRRHGPSQVCPEGWEGCPCAFLLALLPRVRAASGTGPAPLLAVPPPEVPVPPLAARTARVLRAVVFTPAVQEGAQVPSLPVPPLPQYWLRAC